MRSSSLWDFAVAVYAMDGVSPICLRWQDEFGVDVTVVLSAAWQATRGRALSRADVETLSEAVRQWRDDVIKPLRAVRRHLKQVPSLGAAGDVAELRRLIGHAELYGERMALSVLEQVVPGPVDDGRTDAPVRKNIETVLSFFDDSATAGEGEIDRVVSAVAEVADRRPGPDGAV